MPVWALFPTIIVIHLPHSYCINSIFIVTSVASFVKVVHTTAEDPFNIETPVSLLVTLRIFHRYGRVFDNMSKISVASVQNSIL